MRSQPTGDLSSAALLTADLGNSRLKLRAWSRDGSALAARDVVGEASWAQATRAFAGEVPVAAAALSSVASADLEAEVLAALRASVAGPILLGPPPGLAVDVREPGRVGPDRLYAARGALELARRDAIVVDAGTALTVDALRVRGDVATFLGGAIAPGPALLARALSEHTARLPRVEPRAGVHALGRDTESALRAGIAVGFHGAARELCLRVAREAGFVAPALVLTGGAAALLLDPPLADGVLHDSDLVHRGLLAALRASLAR